LGKKEAEFKSKKREKCRGPEWKGEILKGNAARWETDGEKNRSWVRTVGRTKEETQKSTWDIKE